MFTRTAEIQEQSISDAILSSPFTQMVLNIKN